MDLTKYKPAFYLFFILLALLMLYFILDLLIFNPNQNIETNNFDSNIPRDINAPHTRPISFFLISPIMGFLGAIIGAVLVYFLIGRLNKTQIVQKKNTKIILNFLTEHEKKVIEILIENNGNAFQYELNRIPGLTRVKTHRLLKSLDEKGIITLENYGKINKVVLNKELLEVLKNN